MQIYLIRHTSVAEKEGLCYGQTDIPLATDFMNEFKFIENKLPIVLNNFTVFSSPLSRCSLLANFLSKKIIVDERLKEMNFGDWENSFFDCLPSEALRTWTEDYVNVSPPNGENFLTLFKRVELFWFDLLNSNHENVVIVTHAGVIRALLALVLDLPLTRSFQFSVNYGSIHKIENLNKYTYIHYLNL